MLLQCVVVCCSVLQCGAVRCSVLQYVAVCCSVLQRVTICLLSSILSSELTFGMVYLYEEKIAYSNM